MDWAHHEVIKNKWTQDLFEWYPHDGKRNRGRPIRRWEDDLPKGWRQAARNRYQWRNMEGAYVLEQPEK